MADSIQIPNPGDGDSYLASGSILTDEPQPSTSQSVARDPDGVSSAPETTPLDFSPPLSGCAIGLALGLPILYALLLLVEVTSYIWAPISIALYSLVILAVVSVLTGTAFSSRQVKIQNIQLTEIKSSVVVLSAIALLVSFSQISKHLNIVFGGFSADSLGYWHWLRYGFANLFEGAFFDIPAIYNWGVSEIQPTVFWSQTIVFIFRTSLEFLIVANILSQVRHARRLRGKSPRKDHQTYLEFLLDRGRGLLLAVLWSIPTVIAIGAVANDGLDLESSWSAIRLSAPVGFGIWLAWQSLRGMLRFSGFRNRLLALAGVIIGIWLLTANWPAFRDYMRL